MGLAASQSRFLALTSRKAACEFQSMQYAQQKMSISRELTKASSAYENSLNATKLVWDASTENSTTTGTDLISNLSYDTMMKPSELNAYNPYLITNPQGQVVLDSQYAQAAEAAGLAQSGTTRTEEGFIKFIKALSGQPIDTNGDGVADTKPVGGILSDSMASSILTKHSEIIDGTTTSVSSYYQENASVGATPLDKTKTNAMTYANLLEYLKENSFKFNLGNLGLKSDTLTSDNTSTSTSVADSSSKVTDTYTIKNGDYNVTLDEFDGMSLGDILAGNYTIGEGGKDSKTNIVNYAQAFIAQISKLLGYDPSGNNTTTVGLNTGAYSLNALQNAYQVTLTEFGTQNSISGDINNVDKYNAVLSNVKKKDFLGITTSTSYSSGVSLTNILNAFLTNYAEAMTSQSGGYVVADKVSDSNLVTNDNTYYYITANNDSAANDETLLNADFYSMLYNQICSNGWTDDKQYNVDNPTYLENELKNGQLFISSLSSDGYFYQADYTKNGYVKEVADSDAIALAEVQYTTVKSKLNNQEESIDLKAKNLDLEISAITTEYDTVKNLISKNIEKTFAMFSS